MKLDMDEVREVRVKILNICCDNDYDHRPVSRCSCGFTLRPLIHPPIHVRSQELGCCPVKRKGRCGRKVSAGGKEARENSECFSEVVIFVSISNKFIHFPLKSYWQARPVYVILKGVIEDGGG